MDRETLSIVFTKIRGRVGDEVGYVVNGKQRWRGYAKPVQPMTTKQCACNSAMTKLVNRWRGLSDEEKAPWNKLAGDGGRKRVTGFNLYMSAGLKKSAERRMRRMRRMVLYGNTGPCKVKRFVRTIRLRARNNAAPVNLPAVSHAPT